MTDKDLHLTMKGNYDISAPSQMAAMAKVLKAHITAQGLSTLIMGKHYTNVEGWQFAGGLMGYFPKVVEVENLSTGNEKKWRADVEIIRIKDGFVMGTGAAICSNAENKKKSFDEYAIMSMAQTRAIGKAYRNLIGWVMKLAGYEATPSEEMVKMGEAQANSKYQKNQTSNPPQKSEVKTNQLEQLKTKLFKMGAKTEAQAMKILKDKTGLIWASFKGRTPKQIQIALANLLNQ
jgi:hypothetical protein